MCVCMCVELQVTYMAVQPVRRVIANVTSITFRSAFKFPSDSEPWREENCKLQFHFHIQLILNFDNILYIYTFNFTQFVYMYKLVYHENFFFTLIINLKASFNRKSICNCMGQVFRIWEQEKSVIEILASEDNTKLTLSLFCFAIV